MVQYHGLVIWFRHSKIGIGGKTIMGWHLVVQGVCGGGEGVVTRFSPLTWAPEKVCVEELSGVVLDQEDDQNLKQVAGGVLNLVQSGPLSAS